MHRSIISAPDKHRRTQRQHRFALLEPQTGGDRQHLRAAPGGKGEFHRHCHHRAVFAAASTDERYIQPQPMILK